MTENTLGNKQQAAHIQLYEHTRHELSLRGLAEFEYCWVISFFHLNQGFNPLVTPPRGPRKKQGVFATRSPHRPNSIGLSCIRITGVNEREGIVHILGVDLLDGTAVLDIKPCMFCTFISSQTIQSFFIFILKVLTVLFISPVLRFDFHRRAVL